MRRRCSHILSMAGVWRMPSLFMTVVIVIHLMNMEKKILEMTATIRSSLIEYCSTHEGSVKVSAMSKTIIKARAPLRLHRARRIFREVGTGLCRRKASVTPSVANTLIALPMIVTRMSTQTMGKTSRRLSWTFCTMSPMSKKTSVLDINPKNHQNCSIVCSTCGEILVLP